MHNHQSVGCGCESCGDCARSQSVGMAIVGADAGVSLEEVDRRIRTFDRTMHSRGVRLPKDWHDFVERWNARVRRHKARNEPWHRGELTAVVEELARFAEEFGGAMQRQRVAGVGRLPANVGAGLVGNDRSRAATTARQVDDAFSSVWDAVKGVVPYGAQFDELHKARRGLLYGEGQPDPVVKEMQALSRKARKGDKAAQNAVKSMKERARKDANTRRRWHVAVSVMRDDQGRIERLSSGTGDRVPASPAPSGGSPAPQGAGGFGGMLGQLGGLFGGRR